ncbi:MAG TPA: hypothetical protein VMY88_10715 [Acidimicrobiales bacterium]|nr:hypothetical protein [Acidimicrobiales bacterium]
MSSTIPNAETDSHQKRSAFYRGLFALAITAFVIAGAANVFGVRHSEVAAEAKGYQLTVKYGASSRPGLATLWEVEIRHAGGFDGPITLATTASYFGAFDENGLDPDPDKAYGEDEQIIWEFEPPEGDVFSLSFDARIEPAQQLATFPARTALLDESGAEIVAVSYETRVWP